MPYDLNTKEVKKVIDAVLNNKPYDKDQFMFYHLNRNHFNVKSEIRFLKHANGKRYTDNFSRIWEVQPDFANRYHMPKRSWKESIFGSDQVYSRKFLLDDTTSGLDGEYEMVIRHDGKRIDALTHETYQETYNFVRSNNWLNFFDHKKLDIDPHEHNSNYTFRQDMGWVTVTE